MPLPISKTALDRLGVRLAAGDSVSEEDLAALAQVIDAYQDVLNGVKHQLSELGFSATTRMKTTGTLVDKLRRETARLSQVQDLAGARIVVPDRAAQDKATSKLRATFESAGCPCRIIDRREHPSHGYRAVHLVIQVDKVPVEIQVRTDLQDSWAQLLERLADIWGRGIRYGEEPEAPDTQLAAAAPLESRREVISILMQVSDIAAQLEAHFELHRKAALRTAELAAAADVLAKWTGDFVVEDAFPDEFLSEMDQWVADSQNRELTLAFTGWRRMTRVPLAEALRQAYDLTQPDLDRAADRLAGLERELRAILSKLAAVIGEE